MNGIISALRFMSSVVFISIVITLTYLWKIAVDAQCTSTVSFL